MRKMSDGAERGFTLLEMVCVLAIIALLAAVLLPFIPRRNVPRPFAGLCAADGDAPERGPLSPRSAAGPASQRWSMQAGVRSIPVRGRISIHIPDDVRFDAILPQTCRSGPRYRPSVSSPTGRHAAGPSH